MISNRVSFSTDVDSLIGAVGGKQHVPSLLPSSHDWLTCEEYWLKAEAATTLCAIPMVYSSFHAVNMDDKFVCTWFSDAHPPLFIRKSMHLNRLYFSCHQNELRKAYFSVMGISVQAVSFKVYLSLLGIYYSHTTPPLALKVL